MTVFTKEMKDRGMIPMCAGLRSRLHKDRVALDLVSAQEEQTGEMEFDCCIGTSYQTAKMRADGAAPVCTTGIHVARYRWANKEAAVVTNPDTSAIEKGRAARPKAEQTGPDPSRAFASDSHGRRVSRAQAGTGGGSSWTESFKSAWQQSKVIVEKTAQKAADPEYASQLGSSMVRAHSRLVAQAGAQVDRVSKFLNDLQQRSRKP
jgi:hypothetical protein